MHKFLMAMVLNLLGSQALWDWWILGTFLPRKMHTLYITPQSLRYCGSSGASA